MELHHKAHLLVQPAQAYKQLGLVGVLLGGGEVLPGQGFDKGGLRLLPGARGKVGGLQALVGDEAAPLLEIGGPLGQRLLQVAQGGDFLAGDLPQADHPVPEARLLRVQGGLRPEGGQHLHREAAVSGQGGVVLQGVRRVVGGAQGLHVALANEPPGGEALLPQFGVAGLPNGGGALFAEEFLHAEVVFQLHVGPGVQGVAHALLHGAGPGQKLLVGVPVPGDELLGHAVCPHEPPLVVVAPQPHLGDGLKPGVLPDLLGA